MTTVHVIYPHGPQLRYPHVVGRSLAAALGEHFDVALYDWDEPRRIRPARGDLLVGHPHPTPWTVFRRSMRDGRFARVISLFPFNTDIPQNAYADHAVRASDLFLAITGNYWFQNVKASAFSHWWPKMIQVDLAIDRSRYPTIKSSFGPPGNRRILFIGHSGWQKNPDYLVSLAARRPKWDWGWVGHGRRQLEGFRRYGPLDLSQLEARKIVGQHDIFITVGRFDSNPGTILESMAWGLIPVCTPQSGYVDFPGIANVPLDDVEDAVCVLDELQFASNALLEERQRANLALLDSHFSWPRFCDQVLSALRGGDSPSCERIRARDAARLRFAAATSPYAPLRPVNARRACGALARRFAARAPQRRLAEE